MLIFLNVYEQRYESKGTNPLLTKRCLCPFKKYPTRVYFPTQIINKLHMQKLRVYVSAENVLTITSLPSGFDPETTYSSYSDGNSGKTYPLQTTISFGLNATF